MKKNKKIKTLEYHLDEAIKQIKEFREQCDPDEKYVLVTPQEFTFGTIRAKDLFQ